MFLRKIWGVVRSNNVFTTWQVFKTLAQCMRLENWLQVQLHSKDREIRSQRTELEIKTREVSVILLSAQVTVW